MRRAARIFSGPVLTIGGLLHFVAPRAYQRAMPAYLPAHRQLVLASGVAEAATGIGSMFPATRRAAGWLGIATLVAIFPANVHLGLHPEALPDAPAWVKRFVFPLRYRGPLQLWMIWAVYTTNLRPREDLTV